MQADCYLRTFFFFLKKKKYHSNIPIRSYFTSFSGRPATVPRILACRAKYWCGDVAVACAADVVIIPPIRELHTVDKSVPGQFGGSFAVGASPHIRMKIRNSVRCCYS
jgi:hypothetical protein